jgi:hypothetical protein
MEMALAILMVLGIFVGIPVIIGLAITGVYFLNDRKVRKVGNTGAAKEAEVINKKLTKEKNLVV